MRLQAFTVRDAAVEAFLPPFFVRGIGEALRSFKAACMDQQHMFHRNIADYSLFAVGYFDDGKGVFEPLPVPELVTTALDICKSTDVVD